MKLSDFDFELPAELIAQKPAEKRDHSRLLIGLDHRNYHIDKFYNLVSYLQKDDLLIFNDSKVINSFLNLGKATINLNKPIVRENHINLWSAFAKPAKKLKEGDEFTFGQDKILIKKNLGMGEFEIEFILAREGLFDFLNKYGSLPLPGYIKRKDGILPEDLERYQNIYSNKEGSVAAPTAGLHFTGELIESIKKRGVDIAFVTLHVGGGTFLPVKTENILEHKMHSEFCTITEEVADKINAAKKQKRRIIVVGTTAMRTLESFAQNGEITHGAKATNIFITPGYKFQIADFLITNFHLPKSTLFMLVCAFSGMENMKNLYQYAIENKMRFFSYGDAMIIGKNQK